MTSQDYDHFLRQIKHLQSEVDEELLAKAYGFSETAHTGQKRFSGESYIEHPKAVAIILAEWGMPTTVIVAGLLHDTVEDGAATKEDLTKEFGQTIAELVDGVTKISDLKLRGSIDEQFVENLRKMIVAMSKDLRVVLVKLADRLHNMRTLQYVPAVKQKRIAKETLEIYAPLADRLGMGQVKGELEDLAFPYVYPEDYQWLVEYAMPYYRQAEERIEKARKLLLKKLADENIRAQIHGRKKHLYSLYKKLLRPEINRDMNLIQDIVALRIIVDSVRQCYTALGIVHKLWKPVPKLGVSDFIAQPKPNGYRSLHTKVFIDGQPVEIQIRTQQMHQEAEYGVASHWQMANLKAAGKLTSEDIDKGHFVTPQEKLSWVRQLADLTKDIRDNQELIRDLKVDAFQDRIFVFTPKGDVVDLPMGSTPIDFAYNLHTQLGDYVAGAKINGKLVGLDHQLASGDICELVKSKEAKEPSRDWLNFVITATARRHIQKHVRGGRHES